MKLSRLVLVGLVVLLLAVPVAGHVPDYPQDNTAPERAVDVSDPMKSWAFYDSLAAGQVRYYRMTLEAGQQLHVGTFTPEDGAFRPSLVIMSPSLNETDDVPPQVQVPAGMGTVTVEGERPADATYEPFTPSANYHTATFDRQPATETTYLVAVYEPANRSGPVGVTIGTSEQFSVTDFLTVPFDLVRTHLWEGQHPLLAIGPFAFTVLLGSGIVRRRWQRSWQRTSIRGAVSVAGLLIAGTGVNTAVQMGLALLHSGPTPAALLTAVFAVVPVLGGGWVIRLALRDEFSLDTASRGALGVVGGLALVMWAGFIVGPALLISVAALPSRFVSAAE